MSAAAKLAGFAVAIAALFAAAVLAGQAIGPAPAAGGGSDEGGHATEEPAVHGEAPRVRGLAVADRGLRLVAETPELRRGARERLSFRIVRDDGSTVRDFDVEHEKRMHLILARRDLTGFQHLHPRQRRDGAWTTRARIPRAGSYRMFADFTIDGEAHTLAHDVRVDGPASLGDLPDAAPLSRAAGGYQVRLHADRLLPGRAAELSFAVHRRGRPVRVQPYLGAGGHLVALREGDLAYLHVHPVEDGAEEPHASAAGEPVRFEVTFPTEGRYRLFLQFRHDDRVRTASFTVEAG